MAVGECVPVSRAIGNRVGVGIGAGVEAIRGGAALHAELQRAAVLGCVRRKRWAHAQAEAKSRSARYQFATVDDQSRGAVSFGFFVGHDRLLLRCCSGVIEWS